MLRVDDAMPVVDMSAFDARQPTSAASLAVAETVHRGLADIGLLYVENHGVEPALVRALMDGGRAFFALPRAIKESVAMHRSGRAWRGWFPLGGELTMGRPDWKEGLYLGLEHPPDHPDVLAGTPTHGANPWPGHPRVAELAGLVVEYLAAMTDLGQRLMSIIAVALGLSANYFLERFTSEPTVLLRMFHYPHDLAEPSMWGVQEHTDMVFLSMIAQDDCGGLQVQTRAGEWLSVPIRKDAFVVNIGDMLEYWTHGLYRATPHRVRNPSDRDRLSVPFFFDPNWHATLAPIERAHIAHSIEPMEDVKPRWDGLDLHGLDAHTTYGAFVWRKISKVFPALAGD